MYDTIDLKRTLSIKITDKISLKRTNPMHMKPLINKIPNPSKKKPLINKMHQSCRKIKVPCMHQNHRRSRYLDISNQKEENDPQMNQD